MRRSFILAEERPVSSVPRWVLASFAAFMLLQITWQASRPAPEARADQLPSVLPVSVLRVSAIGEPIWAAQLMALYLQSFDTQPGISIPFKDLDYEKVKNWLDASLRLDPVGQYPLMLSAQVYGQVPVEEKQRLMMDFVYRAFLEEPDRRWRWLAHCAIMARHRLNDVPLALRYAEAIANRAGKASGWARQMRIFMLADMGEKERAAVLLGGLLASGEVTDTKEIHFLTERFEELKGVDNSTLSTKSRQQ